LTYLLDTSAIIGWLERSDSSLPPLLAGTSTALYHPVTLGELHTGIVRATDDEREMRTNTLRFTTQRLEQVGDPVLPAEHFGALTAQFARTLSHNDFWILAAAIATPGLTLATEDTKFFDVADSDELEAVVRRRGWVRPACRLVESSPILAQE